MSGWSPGLSVGVRGACGAARQQQIGSLDDVRYAVLETNGKVSFFTGSA